MTLAAKVSPSEKNEPHENPKGLHWAMAVTFVLGDMVGGGMVVLPSVLVHSGLTLGLVLLMISGAVATYTAWQLSEMWIMMQIRWPKYQKFCRKPYGEMAMRACGPKMRSLLSFFIILNQFGFDCVLILLASKNAAILFNFFFSIKISYCYLILIVGLIVWPVTMLKSPMHFWQVAAFSALSSSVGVILIVFGTLHDAPECMKTVAYTEFNTEKFFMALGTLGFAFGGHAVLPTIQHDLKRPATFKYTLFSSFSIIVLYYALTSITGSLVYGDSLGDNIIPSIQLSWAHQTVNAMIAIHVLCTIVIVFSPMTQLCEEYFKIPHTFGWQRFVIRTVIFWLAVFVALSLPNFGPFMDLIGGSTMKITSWILPPIFYLYMIAGARKREEKMANGDIPKDGEDNEKATWREVLQYNTKYALAASLFCIVFGIIGGVVASGASIMKLSSSEVAAPCYVQYFRGGLPFNDINPGTVNCCGAFRNTTVGGISPDGYCSSTIE